MLLNNEMVGAFYDETSCLFRVWAPQKEKIELETFNGKSVFTPMLKSDQGYWEVRGDYYPGMKYRYRVDGKESFPDPASMSQPDGVHGPSAVADRSFAWTDAGWEGIDLADMIIYETHTGCFTPEHNFAGIRSKFSYLKNLGINTIELMPVASFPGNRNWGYDGVYPFAVQESYGGPKGLKSLVNEAHQNGLSVVLDVVYNHLGPDGNYASAYGAYFTEKYRSLWGSTFNLDDKYCDGVRSFIIQNALMWLDEFHIDGLRLDAVHAIIDLSAKHLMKELAEQVTELQNRLGVKKNLIAEIDLNDTRYIQETVKGGYGLSGQWADEFHHSLHALLTGERNGYYEDFGQTEHLVKAIAKTYVYDGNYSTHRKRKFGSDATPFPADRFIVFIQNHDQTGNRMLGERLSALLSLEQLMLASAVMLLSPYVPLLFMGEEYGEKNPFLFFVDHTDETVIENTRKGRKQEFAHFYPGGDFPDPGAEETFLKSCLSWNTDENNASTLFRWYQHLIQFRKSNKAMKGRNRSGFNAWTPTEKLVVMERKYENDKILILFNFSDSVQNFRLDAVKKDPILNSHASGWSGNVSDSRSPGNADKVLLSPYAVCIFEY
ncbi:MAG: malto-oligosyltrehalose trehalohydrolase [Bacteroidota bacterium]|nr:malto-oligosyltrehalose trehalohydrolase [Bacteroidota bacterium]